MGTLVHVRIVMHCPGRAPRAGAVLALCVMLAAAPCLAAAGLDDAYRLYKKAESRLEVGAYDKALELVNDALERHAESGSFRAGIQQRHYYPHYLRGLIHLRLGDPEAALRDFEHELALGRIQSEARLLTRLRGALQEAEGIDTEPPVVHVDDVELVEFHASGAGGADEERVSVRLRGSAIDLGSGIRSMTAAGQEMALVPEEGSYRFDETLTVPSTVEKVRIVAVDSAGNVGEIEQSLDVPPLDLGPVARGIHAVVVGVNEYDRSYRTADGSCRPGLRSSCRAGEGFACYNLPDLSHAASDAERFHDLLIRRGVPRDNVRLLTSRDGKLGATRENVLAALEHLERIEEADRAIFFFSGHGVSSKRQENLMLLSDTRAWECAGGEAERPTALEDSALGVAEVAQHLMRSPVGERYIILDACRSPRLVTKGNGGEPSSPGFSKAGIKGIGTLTVRDPAETGHEPVVFYSTLERKVSIEWNKRSSGYFTYFLLQGLRRDLPLDGLKRYVQQAVKRQTMEDLCSADRPGSSCPYLQAPYLQLPKALEQDYELQSRTFILGGAGQRSSDTGAEGGGGP